MTLNYTTEIANHNCTKFRLGLLIWPLIFPACVLAAGAPGNALQYSPAEINFGNIWQYEIVAQVLQLSNRTHQAVIVESIQIDCGCTLVEAALPVLLSPGGMMPIKVAFNALNRQGPQAKKFVVLTSAGTVKVEVHANVRPRFDL